MDNKDILLVGVVIGWVIGMFTASLLVKTYPQVDTPSQAWKLYVEQVEYHEKMLRGEE